MSLARNQTNSIIFSKKQGWRELTKIIVNKYDQLDKYIQKGIPLKYGSKSRALGQGHHHPRMLHVKHISNGI